MVLICTGTSFCSTVAIVTAAGGGPAACTSCFLSHPVNKPSVRTTDKSKYLGDKKNRCNIQWLLPLCEPFRVLAYKTCFFPAPLFDCLDPDLDNIIFKLIFFKFISGRLAFI